MLNRHAAALGLAAAVLAPWPATAWADSPAELVVACSAKAGAPPQPEKDQKCFTTNFGREMGLSCSSCHGVTPVRTGRDVVTEKPIAPLAPAANARRGAAVAQAGHSAHVFASMSAGGRGVLSQREHEVLHCIAAGDSYKMIARKLNLSPHTAKRHVAHILDKLDARSRAQAAAWLRSQH